MLSEADSSAESIILTYRYRLLPSKSQHRALNAILEDQRLLYNAALQERNDAWRLNRHRITKNDQCKSLTIWRGDDEIAAGYPVNLQRWTIRRVDDAYKGFFARCRKRAEGESAGFPRFRSKSRWRSFGFNEFSGITFDGKRLRFKGMPSGIRVALHRPIPTGAEFLAATFTKGEKGWVVGLQLRIPLEVFPKPARTTNEPVVVGYDLGLTDLLVGSDGTRFANARTTKRYERELRLRQRALARCRRGSKRRRKVRAAVIKLHAKIANCRETHLHQVTSRIVATADVICLEDLKVKSMISELDRPKSMHDAAWSKVVSFTRYKAERAGKRVMFVNPKGTTQRCSSCGKVVPKGLYDRTHACPHCGLTCDRDLNASINIKQAVVLACGSLMWPDRACVEPGISA